MFCRYCGTKLPDNSIFCSNCGKKLVDTPPEQEIPVQEPESEQEPPMQEPEPEQEPPVQEPESEQESLQQKPIPEQKPEPEPPVQEPEPEPEPEQEPPTQEPEPEPEPEEEDDEEEPQPQEEKRKGNPIWIVLFILICILSFVAGALIAILPRTLSDKEEGTDENAPYYEVVSQYLEAYASGKEEDASGYCLGLCQEYVKSSVIVESIVQSLMEEDAAVSYRIGKSKALNKSQIESLQEEIEDAFDHTYEFEEAYTVEILVDIKGAQTTEELADSLTVVNIDSDWYIWYMNGM